MKRNGLSFSLPRFPALLLFFSVFFFSLLPPSSTFGNDGNVAKEGHTLGDPAVGALLGEETRVLRKKQSPPLRKPAAYGSDGKRKGVFDCCVLEDVDPADFWKLTPFRR